MRLLDRLFHFAMLMLLIGGGLCFFACVVADWVDPPQPCCHEHIETLPLIEASPEVCPQCGSDCHCPPPCPCLNSCI